MTYSAEIEWSDECRGILTVLGMDRCYRWSCGVIRDGTLVTLLIETCPAMDTLKAIASVLRDFGISRRNYELVVRRSPADAQETRPERAE